MEIIRSKNPDPGIARLARKIADSLNLGHDVLWLMSGGSNVPIAVKAMNVIRKEVNRDNLSKLTLTLTDERFGETGHADSNWKQLLESGLDMSLCRTIPVLSGKSLEETVLEFSNRISEAFKTASLIIGQFGIGADSHIAGILPGSPALDTSHPVSSYSAGKYTRITITPLLLKKVMCAFVFVFGEAKREAVGNLSDSSLHSVDTMPCLILRKLPEAYVFTDQV